jgi:ADP-heptose:LPS heptosyltransferase
MSSGRGNRKLRLVDRYLGIPAVYLAGLLRSKRTLPSDPRTIGLLNTAAIGDTVLMSAVVPDIRQRYPNATIALLVGPSNYPAARMIEGVDYLVQLKVFNPGAALQELRSRCLDILLDFGPWSRLNSLYTILGGARFTAGFRTPQQYRHFGFDLAVEHSANVHELENHRRLVRAIGVDPSHLPSLGKIDHGEEPVPGVAGSIVCHMWPGGSGAELKEWPTERWLALASAFTKDGYRLILTGSPDQHALNERFMSLLGPRARNAVSNLAGRSLVETARILSQAALVVSVNTGVMHMAAAAHVPLVALHGPTNVNRWGPISDHAIAISSPDPGCGYLNLGFEYPRGCPPKCMATISSDMVLAASHYALTQFAAVPAQRTAKCLPYSLNWNANWKAPPPPSEANHQSVARA